MNSQVSNMMSVDDHVDKINEAKNKVQNGIFEMAEAITEAVNQLDGRQAELSEKLGMSKGTISKWVSIGSNRRLVKMKDKAPLSFNSLYQLSSLDNQYNKIYGQKIAEKKFLELFENEKITPLSQRNDIDKIIRSQKKIITNKIRDNKENIITHPEGQAKTTVNSEMKLQVLIKSNLFFNTIIVVPSSNQLEKWKYTRSDINEDYPLRNLENPDKNILQQCIIKVKARDIDVAISCLNNWGYNYSNILIPNQKKNALVSIHNEYVVIRGERGRPKEINSVIKSNNSVDLINYAENIGAEPFLFVGEIVKAKNWVYCVG
ncbi:helix-turn-helix domain-containing protein [Alphaproteobacteria bacterium]|nr:helix-turn-helix domain-containing protein [Alphaproteobacteria bacterium]